MDRNRHRSTEQKDIRRYRQIFRSTDREIDRHIDRNRDR